MSYLNPGPAAVFFLADAYKVGHAEQYPDGTEVVLANWTNRGSRVPGVNHVVHFGLQAAIDELTKGFEQFFAADVEDAVADYEARVTRVLGPQYVSSEKIRALHGLGFLPLRFCAVPEGTLVPLRVPSFTVESTEHPDVPTYWLTNFVETFLSTSVWVASTSATLSWDIRRMLDAHAAKTSDQPEFVDWQAHDFSMRGMSSIDSAAASGAGHLLSFTGTDTLVALDWIEEHYPEHEGAEPIFVGGSVPATEHSVMCAGIGNADEPSTYKRLLTEVYPTGFLSIVSDTEDYWKVLTETLPALKAEIMSRDGRLVVRPDSGDPVQIVCGTVPATGLLPNGTPEQKGSYEVLWDKFGGTVNSKGKKVLDTHIGLIYGDSITKERARQIITRLSAKGFSVDNLVFGFGSFFFQYQTRDTFMSAMKATWVKINGVGINIFKNPKTDNGTKKSATGRLAVAAASTGELTLIEQASPEQEAASFLQPIWEDGKFLVRQSLSEVRAQLRANTEVYTRNGLL